MEIKITSNAAETASKLEAMPKAMLEGIASVLDYQNEMSVGQIQATKLSRRGPTTLGVISNRLRSSIRPARAVLSGGNFESSIGSNVSYAAVHEFGIDEDVAVRAHQRKVHSVSLTTAIFNPKTGKISKRKSSPSVTQLVSVKAFTRHMKIPARRYIASTVESRQGDYVSALSQAVQSAWNGGAN